MVSRYQSDPRRVGRISGPLLDRADLWSDNIHIEVPRVEYEKLSDDRLGEPPAAIQARVEAARERQRRVYDCVLLNQRTSTELIELVEQHGQVHDLGSSQDLGDTIQ